MSTNRKFDFKLLRFKGTNVKNSRNRSSAPTVFDEEFGFFSEGCFQEMLIMERKRTERTKKPFLLMLLDIHKLAKSRDYSVILKKISQMLCDSTRDIDVKGWYESDHIIGIIYHEVSQNNEQVIVNKITTNLEAILEPVLVDLIDITWIKFPDENKNLDYLESPNGLRLYSKSPNAKPSTVSLACKRAIDIIGSLVGIIIFAPVLIVVPIIIKLTSKGPVFFRQQRVGLGGRNFTFIKFRSMYVNNNNTIHQQFVKNLIQGKQNTDDTGAIIYKIKNDPRITPIGRFIRKTSLDEIPQFFNILKGEMSLVGPRPAIPYEVNEYDIWHKRRVIETKPGLTGYWQVEGRSQTAFDHMVRMDIQYIRNWSLMLDLKLLVRTPLAMFSAKGAV
jgi:exopolysaccharide biosynthesis polyprenyl glycosylphosphotransferase